MKKLLMMALFILPVLSFAAEKCDTCAVIKDTNWERTLPNATQAQGQVQAASSESTAKNEGQGNGNTITFNQPGDTTSRTEISGTQTIKNVPSVGGPPLTTSNDTCMGSSSGSFNIAGLGIGGGSTWVDNNCKRLKNARELWNMGMKGAGMALMCKDPENREALESTGYTCPTQQEKTVPSVNSTSSDNSLLLGSN